MPNLFEYQEPLTPRDNERGGRGVLIERSAAQRQAVASLRRGGFVTVSAPPRSGVTTFLLGLRPLLARSAYLDLANLSFMDDPPKEAARVLAREIQEVNPDVDLPAHPANVTDVLNAVARAGTKNPQAEMLTVFVDGFDAWSDEPARKLVLAFRAAYTELRTLSQDANGFSLITGSSMDLRDLTASGRTSPLNIAQQIFLQDFTFDEVNELLLKGLVPVVDEMEVANWARQAWELASGHPAITQLIGHQAYELRSSGMSPANAWKELYPAVSELATDMLGSTLGLLAGRADLRRTAAEIYSPDGSVPFDRIHRPIRELLHLGLIRPDEQGIGRPRNLLYSQVLASALNIAGAPHPSVALWRESASSVGKLRPGMKSGARHKAITAKDAPPGTGSGRHSLDRRTASSDRRSPSGKMRPPTPPLQPSTEDLPLEDALVKDISTPALTTTRRSMPPLLSRGTIVGGCGILQRIGRGGMGEVYHARHLALDMDVAIKVLHQSGRRDKRVEQRFLREARTAAQLNHENIVQIRNVGREGPYQFIEMEYIAGGSLGDQLRKGPYKNYSKAMEFMRGSARGLLAAHERGIIHRDLKPDNLMLTKDGKIKVVDFGLAVLGRIDGSRLTTEGTIVGTPHYMAPEQWESRNVDERSDVYSLGATFYHLLTGRTPYDGRTALELISNFSKTPKAEPPQHFNPTVPAPLATMIMKMIEKDPGDRFKNMTEVLAALR